MPAFPAVARGAQFVSGFARRALRRIRLDREWHPSCHLRRRYRAAARRIVIHPYLPDLAPWGNKGIARIQEAQAKFAAAEKNAAMAVINDVGNLHDIHPNDKRTVAKRLSLHALKRNYGWKKVKNESPTLKSWKIEGGKFILSFNDAESFYVYNPDRSLTAGFEVCGKDGVWKPAKISNFKVTVTDGKEYRFGTLEGKDIVVEAEGVAEPKKLRYLHSAPWFGSLYAESGLPVGAFHIGY